MKKRGGLKSNFLVFFGIFILLASIGGVFALIGHSFSEINWGDPNNEAVLGANGQWIYVSGLLVGDLLSVKNRSAIGFNKGYVPQTNLDVNGSMKISGGISAATNICSGVNCLIGGTGGNTVVNAWVTSGGNVYFNSGNASIGNNNPAAKLDVSGSMKVNGDIYAKRFCNSSGNCTSNWEMPAPESVPYVPPQLDIPISNLNTAYAPVCMDDRVALIYERVGDMASVYISGTDPADTNGAKIGWNCGGYQINPQTGFGFINPYLTVGTMGAGKVLFAQWNWQKIAGNRTVFAYAAYEGDPSLGLQIPQNVMAMYTPNTPSGTITLGTPGVFSVPGAQSPNYRLVLIWDKDARMAFTPLVYNR